MQGTTFRTLSLIVIASALAFGCSKKSAPSSQPAANELSLAPATAVAPATAAPATTASATARDTGTGMATGRRQYQPLLITKRLDKSTP